MISAPRVRHSWLVIVALLAVATSSRAQDGKEAGQMRYYLLLSVWGDSDYHNILLHGMAAHLGRPGRLPSVDDRSSGDGPLRIPIPPTLIQERQLRFHGSVSKERFEEIRADMASRLSHDAGASLLRAGPGTSFGYLQLERIGNWVPHVSRPGLLPDGPVVSREVIAAFERAGLRGYEAHPILGARIVDLDWRPGRPLPEGLCEPEDLVLERPHVPAMAERIELAFVELTAIPIDSRRPYQPVSEDRSGQDFRGARNRPSVDENGSRLLDRRERPRVGRQVRTWRRLRSVNPDSSDRTYKVKNA